MKKVLGFLFALLFIFCAACGGTEEYILNEGTFFLVMTNMQYYPGQYEDCEIEYDCFIYEITDVDGRSYTCGVRKCSSGYGCNCGKDTVIGFLLDYGGELPEPKNQSEDTNDKAWVKLRGKLAGTEKTELKIYAYSGDEVDYSTVETISFLTFSVESVQIIEDYSNLNYYVTK